MTLYLNCRTSAVGGDIVAEPYVLEGNGLVDPITLASIGWTIPADRIAGREVVFVTHGFNNSYANGVHALARLERTLDLGPRFVVVGVLWPGDWWIPVINYPTEAKDAVRCGRLVARFVNGHLALASGVSFVAHSLGALLVLEAVKGLDRPAREVCLAAGAVDDNCLSADEYAPALANAAHVGVLASTKDVVLRIAYPVGDFISDVLFDPDSPWRAALGYHGPRPGALSHVLHGQIPANQGYGHGDYLPPSALAVENVKTEQPIRFIRESLLGLPHAWP